MPIGEGDALCNALGLSYDPEWRLLRAFEPHQDGARAQVWVARYPAQFYRLTTGDLEITTGSGPDIGALMMDLAQAISEGMVGFRAHT